MLVFMCGVGVSWVYKSIFGLLFFGIGLVMSVSFIVEDDIPDMAKLASKEANPLYPVPVLKSAKELEKLYYKIKS
jgi:hypothetical protein